MQLAHHPGFGLADVFGENEGAERRCDCERCEQATRERVGIGLRHWPKDMAFNTAQCEEWYECRDDDAGRKKDRSVHVAGGMKDGEQFSLQRTVVNVRG